METKANCAYEISVANNPQRSLNTTILGINCRVDKFGILEHRKASIRLSFSYQSDLHLLYLHHPKFEI